MRQCYEDEVEIKLKSHVMSRLSLLTPASRWNIHLECSPSAVSMQYLLFLFPRLINYEDSEDFGHERTPKFKSTSVQLQDMSILQCHPSCYHKFLYAAIIEATERQEKSLRDLPVELIARILDFVAASSRSTGLALALVSPWLADVTLPARLAHVSLRTKKRIISFHRLLRSSSRAGGAVRTLWISDVDSLLDNMVPAILRACPNLRALGCGLAPLEYLCRAQEPFPGWLLSVQLTLTEFMSPPWQNHVHKWTRLRRAPHGAVFLQNITHLRLTHHCYPSTRHSPGSTSRA